MGHTYSRAAVLSWHRLDVPVPDGPSVEVLSSNLQEKHSLRRNVMIRALVSELPFCTLSHSSQERS